MDSTGNRRRRRRKKGERPEEPGAPAPVEREEPPDDRAGPPAWRGHWFELRYVLPRDSHRPPPWREVERAVRSLEGTLRGEERHEYVYRNPDTHVQCYFVGHRPAEEDEAGLTFMMALPRPEYFAHEALPLAVQVARDLRLDVRPLGPDWVGRTEEPTKEALLATWLECNREALQAREEEEGPQPACDADALEITWEYLILREELERRYGRRGVKVPGVEYLREKKSGRVLRVARWEGLGPTVLPPVDLVYLERPPAPLKSGRIHTIEQLSEHARRWVREVAQPIFHRLYLEDRPPQELLEILADLDGRTMRSFDPVEVEDLKDQ